MQPAGELRQRKAAADVITDDKPTEAIDEAPKPWYAALSVRVILVLLSLFFVMHLFLWKVVYDLAMDTNHERLRRSVRLAIDSLYTFLEHL